MLSDSPVNKMFRKVLNNNINLYIFCSALVICIVEARKLPSFVKPCKRHDPQFAKCYAQAIVDLGPYLKKGVPEFGIPPVDPLVIPRLELQQPEGTNVGFDAVLTNVTLTGGLDFVMKDFQVNLDTGYFAMELFFNRLKMLSDYVARGKILIVSFEGEGLAHGDFGNVTLHASWATKRVKKNGKEHFKVVRDDSTVDVQSISVYFENLFKNNKQITENTNRLINENTDVLYTEIKPIIERTVIDLVTSVINIVNNRYSIDDLYPVD